MKLLKRRTTETEPNK